MFARDRLNGTSAYVHSISYQLHMNSTILQYSMFNSKTVFFADSYRWTSRPGLIFKASSVSTKLGCPALDHGIWWHIFTVNNNHSVVYLSRLNVLQCQKLCNCTIADFSLKSVVMSNQLFSICQISQRKQADDMNFLMNTNEKPALRPVTFFSLKKVQQKVARLEIFWTALVAQDGAI